MVNEAEPFVLAVPSRWPYRIAYVMAFITFLGGVWSWTELVTAQNLKEAVLQSVDAAEKQGADSKVLREMMKSYRSQGREVASWKRRRLGLFLAFGILLVGGFLGTGLVNLHSKMQWQIREANTLDEDDYGGS